MSWHTSRDARDYRKGIRTIGENGRWFSPGCPTHSHGRTVGYTYWFCECDPCWQERDRMAALSYQRRKYNRQILDQIRESHALTAASAQGEPAPKGNLAGPAETRPPVSAPADTPAEETAGTPQVSPSGPSYIETLKEKMRAAGLGA